MVRKKKKKKKKRGRGGKRFWSHGHKVILKVCWRCSCPQKRKSPPQWVNVSMRRASFSELWADRQRRVCGNKTEDERVVKAKKKNGKWKHVFLTEQAVPQRGTDKDLPTGECGGCKEFRNKRYFTKSRQRYRCFKRYIMMSSSSKFQLNWLNLVRKCIVFCKRVFLWNCHAMIHRLSNRKHCLEYIKTALSAFPLVSVH